MADDDHRFSIAIGSLPGEVRAIFDWIAAHEVHFVQLSAAQPAFRPRDLGRSARRDILATLRRRSLALSGIDLWIPREHFTRPDRADEATEAMLRALELAADLGHVPLSTTLPLRSSSEEEPGKAEREERRGRSLIQPAAAGGIILPRRPLNDPAGLAEIITDRAAHLGVPIIDHPRPMDIDAAPFHEFRRLGVDPPAWLSAGEDPVAIATQRSAALGAVRLVDLLQSGDRGPIGMEADGRLDVMAMRIALSLTDRSAAVIDPRGWRRPWEAIEQSLAAWRAALPFNE